MRSTLKIRQPCRSPKIEESNLTIQGGWQTSGLHTFWFLFMAKLPLFLFATYLCLNNTIIFSKRGQHAVTAVFAVYCSMKGDRDSFQIMLVLAQFFETPPGLPNSTLWERYLVHDVPCTGHGLLPVFDRLCWMQAVILYHHLLMDHSTHATQCVLCQKKLPWFCTRFLLSSASAKVHEYTVWRLYFWMIHACPSVSPVPFSA